MTQEEFVTSIMGGDLAAVERGLAETPTLAAARVGLISAICFATYMGHAEIVATLVAAKGDLDIFEACCVGDAHRVAAILDESPDFVNAGSPDGFQPLGFACFFGHPQVLDVLLTCGAELNTASTNAMRVCPIHSAAAHANADTALVILSRLLSHGASPNVVQQGGYTPLHEAARRGDVRIVSLLLTSAANPAAENDAGETPADLAERNGHAAIADLLRG